jgi:hypothetical protein
MTKFWRVKMALMCVEAYKYEIENEKLRFEPENSNFYEQLAK